MTFKKFLRAVITLLIMTLVIFLIKKFTSVDQAPTVYPSRALKIIVPFKPGGGSDRIARVVDEFTEKQFGQKLIFQYKEGGGGHLGMGFASMSKADGYTIATYNTPDIALGPLTGVGNYSLDDFQFIGQIAFDPLVIVTSENSKFNDLQELLKAAKESPGKFRLGISGAKGGADLACRAMLEAQGVDVKITLFASGSELASAVLGEQIHAGASGLTPFLGSIDSIKVLAITGDRRHPHAPKGKTMAEQGITMDIGVGRVFLTQKNVSMKKIKILRKGFKQIFDNPSFKDKMRKIGKEPIWADGEIVKQKMQDFSTDAAIMIKKFYSN